jgi:predicted nucleic acid-binding protein
MSDSSQQDLSRNIKKAVLDTNCFIDAVTPSSAAHCFVQMLMSAKGIRLGVSQHSLVEIKEPEAARELAGKFEIVPYWPIGTIAEQVATIAQLSGTWEDSRRNQEIQEELEGLAKSGNDIRDRGAYLDALHWSADVFVTSDKHLASSGPARRLHERFSLRVLTPLQITTELFL